MSFVLIRRLRREYKGKRVHTCIYTHGHVDHVGGILDFEECATVKVVGHKNVKERFDRYKLTRGYNGHINTKQFNSRAVWPETYRYPDVYYEVWSKSERAEIGRGRGQSAH